MPKWWEPLAWTFNKHNTGRRSFMGLGILRSWEVLPVVIIPSTVVVSGVLYFLLYHWRTRTDINTKFRPPLYETMDLYKPAVAKLRSGAEYLNYKPLVELDDVLKAMYCAEQDRLILIRERDQARKHKAEKKKCTRHTDEE